MKELVLARGEKALVDDADYEWMKEYRWRVNSKGYVVRSKHIRGLGSKIIPMHREIMGLDGPMVDHIDCNPLNNQRSNLRHCTASGNSANIRPRLKDTSSQFRGVTWNRKVGKWQAAIGSDRKTVYLGCYALEIDAARAYDKAALRLHGEFGRPNLASAPSTPTSGR